MHILDLLQISKETRDIFFRELQALDPNNQVHVAQVYQIEKKHQVAKSKRPQKQCEECYFIQNAFKAIISFSKEYMLLDNVNHIRPLYVTAYIKEVSIQEYKWIRDQLLILSPSQHYKNLGCHQTSLPALILQLKGMMVKCKTPSERFKSNFSLGIWLLKNFARRQNSSVL